MTSSYGEGDRYDAAMASINEFIDDRQGDAFGLTVTQDHFIHWVPLTDDTTALAHAPPFLNPKRLPRCSARDTIGKALRECRKLSPARRGDPLIILLSDGYSFDLSVVKMSVLPEPSGMTASPCMRFMVPAALPTHW